MAEMKYGELSKQAAKLGISRQAMWARLQKQKGCCKLCGRKRGKYKEHCDQCRAPVCTKQSDTRHQGSFPERE